MTNKRPNAEDPFYQWMDLRVALSQALKATGRYTVGQICDMTREKVLKLHNVGPTCLRELEQELARFSLSLRPSEMAGAVKTARINRVLSRIQRLDQDLERIRRRLLAIREELLEDAHGRL